jgi:hypothetical protein
MTIEPAIPQFLSPGQAAPFGSPQTQFVASPDATDQEIADAAIHADAVWAEAHAAGKVAPPSGGYTGPDSVWHPAGELLSPS